MNGWFAYIGLMLIFILVAVAILGKSIATNSMHMRKIMQTNKKILQILKRNQKQDSSVNKPTAKL